MSWPENNIRNTVDLTTHPYNPVLRKIEATYGMAHPECCLGAGPWVIVSRWWPEYGTEAATWLDFYETIDALRADLSIKGGWIPCAIVDLVTGVGKQLETRVVEGMRFADLNDLPPQNEPEEM